MIQQLRENRWGRGMFIVLMGLLGCVIGWLIFIYFHLDVGTKPKTADVIIVIEGMAFDRGQKGVELLETGYSKSNRLIISPPTGTLVQCYLNAGAEPEQLILEEEATSTWTNAINTIALMEENNWNSAIVVTTDYHTRRARLSFERASEGKDLNSTYVSSYTHIGGEPYRYLETEQTRLYGLSDTLKYVGYVLGLYRWVDL